MKHALAMIVALLLGGGLAGPAAAHDGHELLVPRPDCIQTILNADTGVPADDCLAGTATFDNREGARQYGAPYPVAEVETERYRMIIHYTVGDRCLAAGLDKAAPAAEPSGPDGPDLLIYRDRWLQIRDGLAAGCGE